MQRSGLFAAAVALAAGAVLLLPAGLARSASLSAFQALRVKEYRVPAGSGPHDVAPGGTGPYGITTTPSGQVWYASLAGSHIARIDLATGKATALRPPTKGQGARRIWSDSPGRLWVSEWNAGRVARYDPKTRRWREWRLPGTAQPYAVYVDDRDVVWLTDFAASAIVRFDPMTQRFTRLRLRATANVRQLLGAAGVVWGAESGADRIVSVSR